MAPKTHSPFYRILLAALLIPCLGLALAQPALPARAALQDAPLCGEGSAPDYGLDYPLQQAHWTVDWQGLVSEATVRQVDVTLDALESDSIAQTMILFKRPADVGNRVNCAVHFLRYMKLGLPSGERKDNGFTFLIVAENNKIDVHYAVGLGLPALTAYNLTELNRLAEQTYLDSGSLDKALLALVEGFDEYARSQYPPYRAPTATPVMIDLPELPAGPLGVVTLCCLLCIVAMVVVFLLWLLIQISRFGRFFRPYSGHRTHFPSGGGGGFRMPGGGGGGGRSRGGGGSGRSGRGN